METDDDMGSGAVTIVTYLAISGNSFKLLFGLIDIAKKMSITRQDRERVVLDLYYNQGKTVREIAKEARMSFRDIGSILNKAIEEKETEQGKEQERQDCAEKSQVQLALSTQAYKLFAEGKNPIEVAVALNVRV